MAEHEGSSERTNGTVAKGYAPALRAVARTAGDIKRIDEQLIDRVREKPLMAAAIALVAGYALGRIFSRWG